MTKQFLPTETNSTIGENERSLLHLLSWSIWHNLYSTPLDSGHFNSAPLEYKSVLLARLTENSLGRVVRGWWLRKDVTRGTEPACETNEGVFVFFFSVATGLEETDKFIVDVERKVFRLENRTNGNKFSRSIITRIIKKKFLSLHIFRHATCVEVKHVFHRETILQNSQFDDCEMLLKSHYLFFIHFSHTHSPNT
jgi:hypothetical protein